MGCCISCSYFSRSNKMDSSTMKEEFKNAGLETATFTLNGMKGWCRLVDAYDADSITIVMPYGGKMHKFNTRMYGIDTCEMKSKTTENKEKALLARNRVVQLICKLPTIPNLVKRKDVQKLLAQDVYLVWVECMEFDKYGRVLIQCRLNPDDTKTISDILIEEKLAYAYFGDTKLTEKEQTELMNVEQ